MSLDSQTGIALINLGTPEAPTPRAVRRYLRQFLGDPDVIDLPAPLRWLLVNAVILPRRPRASAAAYRKIWTDQGSPLLVHTRALAEKVETELAGPPVEVGMRYGNPSIAGALAALRDRGARRFVAVPLFPHETDATTGSIRGELARVLGDGERAETSGAFYAAPDFVNAWRESARPALQAFEPDHVLLSYHGLPESAIRKADASGARCLRRPDCCKMADSARAGCYRAQCYATSRILIEGLELDPESTSTAFQSRLGRAAWIGPYTDDALRDLASRGVRRLAVLCPSFVVDCLETLEEIGIRAGEQWRELGGDELRLAPCPNAGPEMAAVVARLARETASP